MADKINVFPLPNHYFIFEAITELIVSISLASSCNHLSVCRALAEERVCGAQPGQRGEGGEQGAVRALSAGPSRWRAWGAHRRTGEPAGPPCARCPCRRSALSRRCRTCAPDVAQEREPAEPGVGTEPLKSSGRGPASQRKALSLEPRIWPGPGSLAVTHSVGRAPRSGVSWESVAR